MDMPPQDRSALSNPPDVVNLSVRLCQDDDRIRYGYPARPDRPHKDILTTFSDAAKAEARLVGIETRQDWERAGRPFLSHRLIKMTQQYILSLTTPPIQEIAA